MNMLKKPSSPNWFYIKHLATDKVISVGRPLDPLQPNDYVRSKVLVTKQHYTDNELWYWDNSYLRNKSTGLVLDIRKGRLRLIEDTEICLYYKKPYELSQNQLWAVRPATGLEPNGILDHPLLKRNSCQAPSGNVIYSVCNDGWVLDVCCPKEDSSNCEEKLVLFPQDQVSSISQRWEFVHENTTQHSDDCLTQEPGLVFDDNMFDSSIINENSFGYASGASSISLESFGFPNGLTPARKRSSQASINSINQKLSLEEKCIIPSSQTHPVYS